MKLDGLEKVKLPTGTVAKLCFALVAACVAIGSMGVSVKDSWVVALGMVLITVLFLYLGPKIIAFAKSDPDIALLEGADYIKMFDKRSKFTMSTIVQMEVKTEKDPVLLPEAEMKLLAEPEEKTDA